MCQQAWEEMQLEGRRCADWLGKELDGGLTEHAVGGGRGTTSGGTRKVNREHARARGLTGHFMGKAIRVDQNYGGG